MDIQEVFEIYHAFAPKEAKEWVAPVKMGNYGR